VLDGALAPFLQGYLRMRRNGGVVAVVADDDLDLG
jgi:peptide chain release factor 2